MYRWSAVTRALVVFLTCAVAPPLFAAEADEVSDDAEVPTTLEEEGRAEYEDVEALNRLESESLSARVVTAERFTPDVLAPRTGALAALQQDGGNVPAIASGRKRRTGAELLSIPAVRERFEHTEMLGLSIHEEPAVRAYLDFFDGRGKKILARWLHRMGRYQPLIEATLEEEGLPQDLIYVAMIESGFSPYATSPAAAVGVWQFIATTGVEMGLRIDYWVDERRDPVKSTRAAAHYLKFLHDKFGSWPLALAAYNGGPGLVRKEIAKHNSNNYWRIRRNRGMYKETRRYVPKILAAGLVSKNADIFGLDHVEPLAADDWTEVIVGGRTRLSLVARASGADYDLIKRLNPELVRKQTPPGEEWSVRIPKDRLRRFVENFDGYVRRHGAEHVRHTVQFGESLLTIARHYEVAPRVIRVANGFEKRERVSYGEEIVLPKKSLGSWSPKKKSKRTVVVANAKLRIEGAQKHFYAVNRGDTVDVVARGFGLNPADVVLWNDLDPDAKLQPGMVLQLFLDEERETKTLALLSDDAVQAVAPGSRAAKRLASKKKKRRRLYHRVRSGESLWLIARKYKVGVDDIKKWNRKLRRSNLLQPGMKLVVYPGKK